jgi:benzodiazapine receptor
MRWMTLLAVVLNITINILSSFFHINEHSIAEVSQQYSSMFTPAGFTFSIWGVIYLFYFIYAVYQLLPAQRDNFLYDKIAPLFIAANLLGIIWICLFSFELISWSFFVIVALLVISFILFRKIKRAIAKHRCAKWISIPFSLLFAWISVATLANLATLYVAAGYEGSIAREYSRTLVLLVVAMLAALKISITYRDWIYPLVIAWAFVGIWAVNRDQNGSVAEAAIISGGILVLWDIIFTTVRILIHQRRKNISY